MKTEIDYKLDFINYTFAFYGDGGVYPMGATVEQIIIATAKLLKQKNYRFEGDSIDRNRVQDILKEMFGLKVKKPCNFIDKRIMPINIR